MRVGFNGTIANHCQIMTDDDIGGREVSQIMTVDDIGPGGLLI